MCFGGMATAKHFLPIQGLAVSSPKANLAYPLRQDSDEEANLTAKAVDDTGLGGQLGQKKNQLLDALRSLQKVKGHLDVAYDVLRDKQIKRYAHM